MLKAILTVIFISFAIYCYSANLSQPPILKDEPLAEQQYLRDLYDNHNKFEITTTAPNGSRRGEKGYGVIYNNSGTLELWVNSDGATAWQKI